MTHLTRSLLAAALVAGTLALSFGAFAQDIPAERQLILRAAEALGGVERIQSLQTMTLRGYGHEGYQDGGSEITTEPAAPEKMTNLTAYERVIDLPNGRTRVEAQLSRAFVFASRAMMMGLPVTRSLDGDIAFDVAPGGAARRLSAQVATQRRMELLANPIVAVRAALASESQLTGLRSEGAATLVDVGTATGETFTLAVHESTALPLWVRWVGPHENLGELTYRAEFSGYVPVAGVMLPLSFNTVSDFRDAVQLRLHVDRWILDEPVADLAAPAAVRSAPAPVRNNTVEADPVAPGVWLLYGSGGANSILLEFENHLTLFEVPTSRAWAQALIEKAESVVPGKRVAEVIISHHHFDHTGGLRTAIAAGLTIIAQTGNAEWFEELARRPVETFPDALSQNPQPLRLRTVDDHLQLSDAALTVDLYRMIANGHMAHGLMAYVPEHRLLIQGDLFDMNWEVYFWGRTYEDNIDHRDLVVERDVPVHGRVLPLSEVREHILEQTRNAAELCAHVDAAGLTMPGCPLAWTVDEVAAQQAEDVGFVSVGRAAPLVHDVNEMEVTGATALPGGQFIGAARAGEVPPGIEPLERDLFTSPDFYADRELWSDPRYFRCNSPFAIEGLWVGAANAIGDDPPGSAPWGHCDRDYPRESIVSPYPFDTAQAHYEALLEETRQRGGPTEHTQATMPGDEWNGIYRQPRFIEDNDYWFTMRHSQVPTILSLLTDEYQTRMVQETYHHGHTNKPMWPSTFCWPEGFLRRWHEWAAYDRYIMVTPHLVQLLTSGAMNFVTNIHVGREFIMDGPVPRLGENVPRWYGETIGFWDEDTLITWTSNIQGWITHASFEHSNQMQSIEIYTPMRDENGVFTGLNHEAILYDPEALIEPVRIIHRLVKTADFNEPEAAPYVFTECIQTIYPIDGTPTPVTPGRIIEYEVPDMYGRPWAQIWRRFWEQDMQRQEEADIFSFD